MNIIRFPLSFILCSSKRVSIAIPSKVVWVFCNTSNCQCR